MVKRNQGVHTLAASGLLQFAVKLMDMSLSRRQLQLFRRKTNRNHFISSAPSISAKIPTFRHLAIKWLRLQRRLEWGAEIYTCQSSKIREFYRKFKHKPILENIKFKVGIAIFMFYNLEKLCCMLATICGKYLICIHFRPSLNKRYSLNIHIEHLPPNGYTPVLFTSCACYSH